jgi:arylsulfatase A-like enzyme
MAVAPLVGALAIALTNAIAIAVVVSMPPEGLGLRLMHHGFDALQILCFGAWLALPALVAKRYGRGPSDIGWWLLVGASCFAMHFLLETHLTRQADAVLEGKAAKLLFPLYVFACGSAVAAAYVVGGFFARWRVRFGAAVGVLLALIAIVVNHAILRDDYPGVHVAVAWVAMTVLGASVAPRVLAWLGHGRRRQRLVVAGVVLGVAGVVVEPPNRVRLQLFREAGAVSAYVLATTLWRMPSIDAPESLPPIGEPRGYGSRPRPVANPAVAIITVDALRADVLTKRYDAQLPTLSRLRDGCAYFERASAPGSQTSVSLTGMFTGRYFSQLLWKPYGEGGTRFLYTSEDPTSRFPELLGAAGVNTESFVGLIFASSGFGAGRGFTTEHMLVEGRNHALATAVIGPYLRSIRRAKRNQPQLYYTHLMEPHEPYDRGKLKQGSDWDRYISEVAEADRWINQVWREMRRRFPGRAYLLISADHGEAFGEHGTRFHTKTLYQELVHVPLILCGPDVRPGRYRQRVSLVDVGATMFEIFAVPHADGWMGHSLLPLVDGRASELVRPVLIEGRLKRGIYLDDLKVIEDTVRKTVEVYDLANDPGELHNLFDDGGPEIRAAVGMLRGFYRKHTLRFDGYEPPYKP